MPGKHWLFSIKTIVKQPSLKPPNLRTQKSKPFEGENNATSRKFQTDILWQGAIKTHRARWHLQSRHLEGRGRQEDTARVGPVWSRIKWLSITKQPSHWIIIVKYENQDIKECFPLIRTKKNLNSRRSYEKVCFKALIYLQLQNSNVSSLGPAFKWTYIIKSIKACM